MAERIVMLGAGGHAKVLHDALQCAGLALQGYVAGPESAAPESFSGLERYRSDEDLLTRGPGAIALVNGVGSVGDASLRRAIFERFSAAGFRFVTVVHPRAVVAADVLLVEGAQVMAGATIQSGARIGRNALVNTGAVVDHDCEVGPHAHIAPGAVLAGGVSIGAGSHIGAGATVIQSVRVAAGSRIGAGAVVIRDVPAGVTVVGVPARVLP
ncbi:MAG TPA: acetyltransferase [Xanthobacteraceae bacterium]|nr:acetyltransferase [Xanthobacteraceae bacterium]